MCLSPKQRFRFCQFESISGINIHVAKILFLGLAFGIFTLLIKLKLTDMCLVLCILNTLKVDLKFDELFDAILLHILFYGLENFQGVF